MKTLIVTVGTSAITNHDLGRAPGYRDNRSLMGLVSRYLAAPEGQKGVAGNQELFDKLLDAHKEFWNASPQYRDAPRNRRQTSAELLSTYVLAHGSPHRFEPERVSLIASDTNEGWFAALINQRVMEEAWGWSSVDKVQVTGLNASCFGLEQALNECFFRRLHIQETDEVVCNITGGYKGAIPEITLIAARRGWRLYYQHEEFYGAAWLTLPRVQVPEPSVATVREPDRHVHL
jgi:CRISPR/Cas system-associated protein Csm6